MICLIAERFHLLLRALSQAVASPESRWQPLAVGTTETLMIAIVTGTCGRIGSLQQRPVVLLQAD